MTIKIIVFILCVAASAALTLSGLALVLIGLVRKNRCRIMTGIISGLLAFILMAGSIGYVTIKVYGRFSNIAWTDVVTNALDFVFDTLTVTEYISADEALETFFREPRAVSPEIKNFQGIRTEFPGFDNYYLRYNANKELVLNIWTLDKKTAGR